MLQRVNPLVPTYLKNEPTDSPVGLTNFKFTDFFRCHNATEYFTCRLRPSSTACLPSAATVKYKVAYAAIVFIFLFSTLVVVERPGEAD